MTFPANQAVEAILQQPNIEKTMLTEWFKANTLYLEVRELIYVNFLIKWIWNKSQLR